MKFKKPTIYILFICLALLIGLRLYKKINKPISPFSLYANIIPHSYRVGFTNLDQENHIDNLTIKGKMPDWLSGTLFRNGPAKFTTNNSFVSNWFDGLAMVHAFFINNGKVSYTNKFLKSDDYYHVEKTGKMDYAGFVQDPCKSIFKRLFSLFIPTQKNIQKNLPNTNVNIARITDHFIALTETPLPIEFDPKSLETIGGLLYNDQFPKTQIHDTAHPHYDCQRNEYLGYFTEFGRISSHNLFRIKEGSTSREIIASHKIDKPAYMHSFAITKNYAILTILPLRVNPLDLILKNQGFIKNFRWHPELDTEFLVIDRINGKEIGTFKGEPFFAFHTINAYEEKNNIILDIITYPNSSVIFKADFYDLLSPVNYKPSEKIKLKRFTINLNSKIVLSKTLSEDQMELPRINYENFNGKDYNYVYAFAESSKDQEAFYVANQLIKFNVKNGKKLVWFENNCFPGEPVFVSKPNSKIEDEGVVMSVILDANNDKSFLLILDGQSFKEVARVEVPHHIPFGIHGQFYSQI